MKPIFLALSLLCCTILRAQDDKPKTVKDFQFTGNVKSATENIFSAEEKFGEPAKEKLLSKSTYAFNKAGFRTESSTQSISPFKWKMSLKAKYNGVNQVVEELSDDDGDIAVSKAKYNTDKTLKEINITDKKGKLKQRHIFQYEPVTSDTETGDINEFVQKMFTFHNRKIYNAQGKLLATHKFSNIYYDIYDAGKKDKARESFVKDFYGNITKHTIGNGKDQVEKNYTYNDQQQLTKSTYQSGKSRVSYTLYEYNNKGFLSKETDTDGNTVEHSYSYDARNNWVKRIQKKTYNRNVSYEITERSLKYY